MDVLDRFQRPWQATWRDPATARMVLGWKRHWNSTAGAVLICCYLIQLLGAAVNVGEVLGFLLRKIGPGRGRNGLRWWAAGLERYWAD
ncbi:hypothetical protein KY290_029188 [Solanum tuberosum]|uniref:Uncharacterized protein n=1 Tax=Solanum tuberosum TaxID=4113 RepID=A0ABQ7UK21_SOLTU|nr:hypothetical protein KY289_028379 [Solanum tuberosum]KAH0667035.1 hypothetical protein KY285_028241 [Solanum tuberosum]KAH0749956.1 hypothetical protein KY290_029188 [Solanum tuberosum]